MGPGICVDESWWCVAAAPPIPRGNPAPLSLRHARVVNAEVFLSNALINLGLAHLRLGDPESARARLREAIQHAAVPDNRESLARALDALAAVAETAGDPELGATMLGAGEGVRSWIGVGVWMTDRVSRSEEHTSELQSPCKLVCR